MRQFTQEAIRRIMHDAGAVIEKDHLVLTSGRHSEGYANCAPFWERPELAPTFDALCGELAGRLYEFADTTVVLGPETGGGKIAEATAPHVPRAIAEVPVRGITIYKIPGAGKKAFQFKPEDRSRLSGELVAVVDDVLLTGGSLVPTVFHVRACGGIVVAAGVLVNRSKLSARDLGVPCLVSLQDTDIPTWTEAECKRNGPCSRGIPINEQVAHGREYMDRLRAAHT